MANVIVGVEEGDWYKVGENAVGVAVTVFAVIAAKKLGPKMGPRSARGPPKNPLHGNSLDTTKPAWGYVLRDRDTGAILKYGETTQPEKRYTPKSLDAINAELKTQVTGTKREMHDWQHDKILEYKAANGGKRPPLNRSDW